MGPVTIAAAAVLLLTGCGTVDDDRPEPVASPAEPVEETADPEPEPTPEPDPEPAEVEDPEPEPEVETQPARPDPARVRENIRDVFDQQLDRQPSDDELATAEAAWFDLWGQGRDTDAAWMEWFRDRYEAELDRRRRVEQGQENQDTMHEGGSRAGCMSGGAGYDDEDC